VIERPLSGLPETQGNDPDTRMESLASEGDGNYSYIDSEREAQRVADDFRNDAGELGAGHQVTAL
jgi:hypothetical protein